MVATKVKREVEEAIQKIISQVQKEMMLKIKGIKEDIKQ